MPVAKRKIATANMIFFILRPLIEDWPQSVGLN